MRRADSPRHAEAGRLHESALQAKHMRKAKVHVIESPSAEDFFEGRQEGVTLKAALDHAGVPARLRTAGNFKQVARALVEVIEEHEAGGYPIIHLCMHGNDTGICPTSNDGFDWEAL